MTKREDTIERIERVLKLTHKESITVTIPKLTAERAVSMLKEQEAKNVVNMTLSKDWFLIASCPKCNALLTRVEHKNYCGYCGQAVKWE